MNPTREYLKLFFFAMLFIGFGLLVLAMIFSRQVGFKTALVICLLFWMVVVGVFFIIILANWVFIGFNRMNLRFMLFFYPLDILPGPGVDFDQFAFFQKWWNLNHHTGFKGRGFGIARCRVPFDPGIGLYDSQNDKIREGDVNRPPVKHEGVADGVFLQKIPGIAILRRRKHLLIIGRGVHEAVILTVKIKILHLDFFQGCFLKFLTGPVRSVKLGTRKHVFKLALVKRLTLSGFDEIVLRDDMGGPVNDNFQPFSQIAAFIHRCDISFTVMV
jgi:hypothetical protein